MAKESRTRMKRRALSVIGGAICVSCGADDIRVLEVNHINGGGAKESKLRRETHTPVDMYKRILRGLRSITDLNVLCRPCNAIDYIYRKHPDIRGRFRNTWK